MMLDDELAELAADIEANGLREALVTAEVDGETVLVDGRNRRAACKIAGLTDPPTRMLDGEDPTTFVISANIHRRHMTKGQRAMAVAMIYPKPEKLKRKGSGSSNLEGLHQERISEAYRKRRAREEKRRKFLRFGSKERHGGP